MSVRKVFFFASIATLCAGATYVALFLLTGETVYKAESVLVPLDTSAAVKAATVLPTKKVEVMHLKTPDPLKAIYMTQCVVGTPSFRAKLVKLADETEINAIIIDVKDFTGKIAFETDHPLLKASVSDKCGARDMPEFLKMLHEKGIYTIARVTVFQDPFHTNLYPELAIKRLSATSTIWKDYKGLAFIDVGAKPHWEYIVALSKESYAIGFDEINFDYIRFPSDGPMDDMYFPFSQGKEKQVALEEFFAYLHKELKGTGIVTSADLFGMVTVNYHDMNIGQVLERALPYFDYIAPMVYPSHYPKNFNGWPNPNAVPGELIEYTMSEAVKRTVATSSKIKTIGAQAITKKVEVWSMETGTTTKDVTTGLFTKEVYDQKKLRPWLQDFDYGGDYDAADVRAQIQATYDAGLTSWLLWDPGNIYTRDALHPE
jgi:hypothetical protein